MHTVELAASLVYIHEMLGATPIDNQKCLRHCKCPLRQEYKIPSFQVENHYSTVIFSSLFVKEGRKNTFLFSILIKTTMS